MNILLLPLYQWADAIQIEVRDTENRLKSVVSHIQQTFSGDERMMIQQAYYPAPLSKKNQPTPFGVG